jgi:hypothetical protein
MPATLAVRDDGLAAAFSSIFDADDVFCIQFCTAVADKCMLVTPRAAAFIAVGGAGNRV